MRNGRRTVMAAFWAAAVVYDGGQRLLANDSVEMVLLWAACTGLLVGTVGWAMAPLDDGLRLTSLACLVTAWLLRPHGESGGLAMASLGSALAGVALLIPPIVPPNALANPRGLPSHGLLPAAAHT